MNVQVDWVLPLFEKITKRGSTADRYADIFGIYLRHRDDITRVTFWGVADGDSWKNYWPVSCRSNYLLFLTGIGNRNLLFFR